MSIHILLAMHMVHVGHGGCRIIDIPFTAAEVRLFVAMSVSRCTMHDEESEQV